MALSKALSPLFSLLFLTFLSKATLSSKELSKQENTPLQTTSHLLNTSTNTKVSSSLLGSNKSSLLNSKSSSLLDSVDDLVRNDDNLLNLENALKTPRIDLLKDHLSLLKNSQNILDMNSNTLILNKKSNHFHESKERAKLSESRIESINRDLEMLKESHSSLLEELEFDDRLYTRSLLKHRETNNEVVSSRLKELEKASSIMEKSLNKQLSSNQDVDSFLSSFDKFTSRLEDKKKKILEHENENVAFEQKLFEQRLQRKKKWIELYLNTSDHVINKQRENEKKRFELDIERRKKLFDQVQQEAREIFDYHLKNREEKFDNRLKEEEQQYNEKFRRKKEEQLEKERRNKEDLKFQHNINLEQERQQKVKKKQDQLKKDFDRQWELYHKTLAHVRSHTFYRITKNIPPKIEGDKVIPAVLAYICL